MSRPALTVQSVDYHTGGEPFRIVSGGLPHVQGSTVLQRRAWLRDNLDHIRQLLINEPRGHADMYGGFVVPPDDEGADLGVVFFHNEGYSTACGHGTIALATWAVESGLVDITGPVVHLTIDVPSGRLDTQVHLDDQARVVQVVFTNVASFVKAHVQMQVAGRAIEVAVAFGGAFYAILDASALGLAVTRADLAESVRLCRQIKDALNDSHEFIHPDEPELRDIYGVILVEDLADVEDPGDGIWQRNVTVFADGEVDRSPTGSGTSARLALLHHQGAITAEQLLHNHSIVDTRMTGAISATTTVGGYPAVITHVGGQAFRTGTHTFTLDPRDPLGTGFLLR